jgi:ABC-type microcin C transport system duplicated ATPase subunit YejF
MIFQEPMTSLNPVLTIGRQLTEGLIEHLGVSQDEANDRAMAMIDRVGLGQPGSASSNTRTSSPAACASG